MHSKKERLKKYVSIAQDLIKSLSIEGISSESNQLASLGRIQPKVRPIPGLDWTQLRFRSYLGPTDQSGYFSIFIFVTFKKYIHKFLYIIYI